MESRETCSDELFEEFVQCLMTTYVDDDGAGGREDLRDDKAKDYVKENAVLWLEAYNFAAVFSGGLFCHNGVLIAKSGHPAEQALRTLREDDTGTGAQIMETAGQILDRAQTDKSTRLFVWRPPVAKTEGGGT